mgnify:CR=1 FL=1
MITDKTKANAISLLKLGDTPEKVSADLELPLMLVREWCEDIGVNDLTGLQANVHALDRVVNGEILPSTNENTELLRLKIEKTALEIVDHVSKAVPYGDVVQAKSLNLLADTCSKLYNTVINKGQATAPQTPGAAALSMLEDLRKD